MEIWADIAIAILYEVNTILRDIHISIVSHKQKDLVFRLLEDCARLPSAPRMQLTVVLNVPEPSFVCPESAPFPIAVVRNEMPKGFGANHNAAFRKSPLPEERQFFLVSNPDVRLKEDAVEKLVRCLENDSRVGVIAPLVRDSSGRIQSSARGLPTPARLLKKLFFGQDEPYCHNSVAAFQPDWVAGMFMAFPADVFDTVGGFDEGYFLYYEDVDICSRLWLRGLSVQVDPRTSIVHDAQRASRKNLNYLRWHLASVCRFFTSSSYRLAREYHAGRATRERGG